MATISYTPYVTARQLIGTLPNWMSEADGERHEAYLLYERMYWNAPEVFRLQFRGTEDSPVYIPSARSIIETCNRFLAKNFDYVIDPALGNPADRQAVNLLMRKLFAREQFYSKFATQKRYGLIRGDAVWHIIADPTKAQGSRISLYEVDPGSYFPITDPTNDQKIIGVHLATDVLLDGKASVLRQTYRKDPVSGAITTEQAYYEPSKWDDREGAETAVMQQVTPVTALPPQITALPVYLIRNNRGPDQFGSSEVRGLERVAAAVNQTVSDEELALALSGLGVYATNSGPPTDEDGNELDWELGPGRVVEVDGADGSFFNRVQGVGSVEPSQQHLKFLLDQMHEAVGQPAVARGTVDVSIAESGIALALEMAPLLATNAEKEQEMLSVYDHMFYDLVYGWFPAFEQLTVQGVSISPSVDDPIPRNRKESVDELLKLQAAGVVSVAYVQQQLSLMGYEFPDDMNNTILEETIARQTALGWNDPFSERLRQEQELDTTLNGG